MQRRTFMKLMTIGILATAGGCFGSFKATNWVDNLNKGIGGKFINWLVFLGFTIIPVYGVAVLVDVWILNWLEFWFGGSSAQKDKKTDERIVQLSPTQTLTLRKDHSRGVLWAQLDEPGRTLAFTFEMGEDGARLWEGDRLVGSARDTADGGVEVAAGGRVIATHDAATVRELRNAYEAGGSTSAVQWAQGSLAAPNAAHAAR